MDRTAPRPIRRTHPCRGEKTASWRLLRLSCGDYPRDAREIIHNLYFIPACEEFPHGHEAIMPEFHDQPAAWREQAVGLGNQAAIDAEPVIAREQSEFRLMIADFARECGAVALRYVRWIRNDDIEGRVAEGAAEIAFDERDVRHKLACVL